MGASSAGFCRHARDARAKRLSNVVLGRRCSVLLLATSRRQPGQGAASPTQLEERNALVCAMNAPDELG